MPTLLQINVTANWGSTGKIAEQIGVLAQQHGWDSYIAYGRDMNPSKNKLVKIGSMKDVYEHYIENLFLDNEGRASRRSTKKFLKEVDRIKPDIVHLHNIHDHYLNYELLFRYLAAKKIPVVWTQHDQWAITGHCHYNLKGCERWQKECYSCPLSKWYSLDCSTRNHRLKKDLLAGISSLIVVPVSEWLGETIRQSYLKEYPMQVIHNGIDVNVFTPQPKNAHERYSIDKHKKIVLGVAAVWDERKGLNDIYELAKRLSPNDYAIVIVGKLTEEPKAIEGCHLEFIDRTQNALELAQLYSSASVFINPTYQDNYPTTNLDAIACGTPVVTYRTGGSPKSVDGSTGAVVNQGDIDELLNSVVRLSNTDCIEACRRKALKEFDNSKCFNPYISLYNSILKGRGKVVVLGVSSVWNENKGLSDFIALSRNPDIIVVLVGLKEKQAKELRGAAFKDCNLIPICRTQDQKELSMIYSMADVAVSLSKFETFGLTIVEAMACGTPVVVYNNTGQAYIPSQDTGKVIPTGDMNTLTDVIYKIKSNPPTTAICRKSALDRFDKDKCFMKYIDLYDSLLKK